MANNRYAGFRHARPALRQCRLEHGLSLAAVGEAVDFDYSEIAKLERGRRRVSPEIQRALAELFTAASPDELFEERAMPPTRDDALRAELMARAGGCGSPTCQDPECDLPHGRCHASGCENMTRLARQTWPAQRRVRDQPVLYCSMDCVKVGEKDRVDRYRAQGLFPASDVAKELDRAARNILRFGWVIVTGRRLGRQIPGTGPNGGAWFFTRHEIDLMRDYHATSSRQAPHRNPRWRADWYLAKHKSTKGYGKLNRELAAEKGNTVGRPSELRDDQLASIYELRDRGGNWSQEKIARYLGVGVSRDQVKRALAARKKLGETPLAS